MTTLEPAPATGGGASSLTGSSARDEVLARVRSALAGSAPLPPVPRDYRQAGTDLPDAAVLLERLVDRLEDYKATVHRTTPGDLPATIARVLSERAARRLVVPPGLPGDWTSPWTDGATDREVLVDGGLSTGALDRVDGVLTACAVAIAETGTIVLDASPDQGRRAITLVPDLHLCVVRADQVVAGVPEGLARLEPTRPLTLISGPSATSDIELNRVEGVHGPRSLDVLVVDGA